MLVQAMHLFGVQGVRTCMAHCPMSWRFPSKRTWKVLVLGLDQHDKQWHCLYEYPWEQQDPFLSPKYSFSLKWLVCPRVMGSLFASAVKEVLWSFWLATGAVLYRMGWKTIIVCLSVRPILRMTVVNASIDIYSSGSLQIIREWSG